MSAVLTVLGAVLAAGTAIGALTLWGRLRYARRLPSFRCRVGCTEPPWSRRNRRWWRRRTRACWAGNVLLIRTGFLRLWLTPVPVGADQDMATYRLDLDEVRGLGLHPVGLRVTTPDGGRWELATTRADADRLVGPFLAAAMSDLPKAPKERGTW